MKYISRRKFYSAAETLQEISDPLGLLLSWVNVDFVGSEEFIAAKNFTYRIHQLLRLVEWCPIQTLLHAGVKQWKVAHVNAA